MEKRIQIGSSYKEAVLKLSGGYGRWAWNATCYLKSEEFALWNKICEYSYRCQDPNGVLHLKKQSLYNYFSFDGGKEYVERNLESLGNKVLLEKSINIRAADYDFKDKIKYYEGFTTASGQKKEGTRIAELQQISKNYSDFKEIDIQNRKNQIINSFVEYLKEMSMLDN